jgi:signal transduction histidine kinase
VRTSLHLRLILVLALILVPAGALLVTAAVRSARGYYHEVTQRQNLALAANLVHELGPATVAAQGDIGYVVKMLEMAHPGVEIYVLDTDGTVVQAPLEADLATRVVALSPLERLAAAEGASPRLPVLGTDPRRGGTTIFSVAPLPDESGFLYVVLTDEARATLLRSVQASTTLRLVLIGGGLGLLLTLIAGGLSFALLTMRLRRLTAQVRAFDPAAEAPRTDAAPALALARLTRSRDEIDELHHGFTALAQRVREQVAALERSDAQRRELVSNVSHDLRTPLTALRGALEAMADIPDAWLSDDGRHLDTARRNADRLGRLVDGLFELSYLESPGSPLHLEVFPLSELVHDVVQKYSTYAAARDLNLEVAADPARIEVMADIGQIERALSNLLDNAMRYTAPGGSVTVRVGRRAERALVEVADTGVGIAAADQARVFDRFYRVERERDGDGTGLGLAIVQRIVDLHRGAVELESTVGVGTTVRFDLSIAGGDRSTPDVNVPGGFEMPA